MTIKDRKYRRIILPKNKRAEAVVSIENRDSRIFEATVMNISEGGVALSIFREGFWQIRSLDMLNIIRISGESPFDEFAGLNIEVKWVLDNSELTHIGLGCEFKNISAELREKVRKYIVSY